MTNKYRQWPINLDLRNYWNNDGDIEWTFDTEFVVGLFFWRYICIDRYLLAIQFHIHRAKPFMRHTNIAQMESRRLMDKSFFKYI